MKAKRSIDTDVISHTSHSEIRMILSRPTDERFHCLFDAFRQGFSIDEMLAASIPVLLRNLKYRRHGKTAGDSPWAADIIAAKRPVSMRNW
jgi:hypothetical protein